jgi:hypothetical protein
MAREEAQAILDQRIGGQTDLDGTMRVIEAMLVVNDPHLPAAEIDRRVRGIRKAFLGESPSPYDDVSSWQHGHLAEDF